jgi:ketosteroid isomerase-like protein
MISLERCLPVNPPGTTSRVSRAEVWRGLVLKADNALPFVPQMTYCQVIERASPTSFVREIEFKGDRMKERVTLEPERTVTFERLAGPVLGTIRNFIDEDAKGELSLRFAFDLEVSGLAAGSAGEKDYARTMEKAYLGAVDATLAAIRKLHDESPAGEPAKATRTDAPPWLTQYYADVDAQRMDAFLAHHAPGARVVFANHPPAVGHEAIRGAIGGLWGSIAGLSHRPIHIWQEGATTLLEAAVTYIRKDGKTVTVPCVSIFETQGGKVTDLRVHIDLAPVFA